MEHDLTLISLRMVLCGKGATASISFWCTASLPFNITTCAFNTWVSWTRLLACMVIDPSTASHGHDEQSLQTRCCPEDQRCCLQYQHHSKLPAHRCTQQHFIQREDVLKHIVLNLRLFVVYPLTAATERPSRFQLEAPPSSWRLLQCESGRR